MLFDEIQVNLFERVKKFCEENLYIVDFYEEFKKQIEEKGGFFLVYWDGIEEIEVLVKVEMQVIICCILFEGDVILGVCMVIGKLFRQCVVFVKVY